MSKKILITGAAGFIGFHLAKLRLEQGDTVHGIDNLNDYYDVTLKESRLNILKKFEKFSFQKTKSIYFTSLKEKLSNKYKKYYLNLNGVDKEYQLC